MKHSNALFLALTLALGMGTACSKDKKSKKETFYKVSLSDSESNAEEVTNDDLKEEGLSSDIWDQFDELSKDFDNYEGESPETRSEIEDTREDMTKILSGMKDLRATLAASGLETVVRTTKKGDEIDYEIMDIESFDFLIKTIEAGLLPLLELTEDYMDGNVTEADAQAKAAVLQEGLQESADQMLARIEAIEGLVEDLQ